MAVQLRPLTLGQASDVLETLSLLNSKNHEHSKLVIYETKVALETDSSTWRTMSSWSTSVISTGRYYAGYSDERVSRDIAVLPDLLERAYYVFKECCGELEIDGKQKNLALAQSANKGLQKLIKNQYQNDLSKSRCIKQAQSSVEKIIAILETRPQSFYVDPDKQASREKDQKINLLEQKIAQLEKTNIAQQSEIESITVLRDNFKNHIEIQKKEITRLQGVILSDSLNGSVDPNTVSTTILIGRLKLLTDILATRKL